MNRRGFLKRTVGAVTTAVLFGRSLKAGTREIVVNSPMFQAGDVFRVPRTKENFIVSCVDGRKITFSRPLQNTVRDDDEIILLGNVGVRGNTTKSGWWEEKTWQRYFKGRELK